MHYLAERRETMPTAIFTLFLYCVMWILFPKDVAIYKTTYALFAWLVFSGSIKLLIRLGVAFTVFLGGSVATAEVMESSNLLTAILGGSVTTAITTAKMWLKFLVVEGFRTGGAYIMLSACTVATGIFSVSYEINFKNLALGGTLFILGIIANRSIE